MRDPTESASLPVVRLAEPELGQGGNRRARGTTDAQGGQLSGYMSGRIAWPGQPSYWHIDYSSGGFP